MLLPASVLRVVVFVLTLVGCGGLSKNDSLGDGNDPLPGGGSGSGGIGSPAECMVDSDCILASSTCCECPTFALPASSDQNACGQVGCPPAMCSDNVAAVCTNNTCTVACKPLECDLTCQNGFVIDATGCVTCECAAPDPTGCTVDSDCEEVEADCCGCALGGEDTAVLASDALSTKQALNCPTNPICPGNNTCQAGAAPACVQSRCELLTPAERTPPANECGLPSDKPCQGTEVCTINAVGPANARGVGVCLGI